MGARRRIARPRATIAVCSALAALLVYAGHARRAGELATKERVPVGGSTAGRAADAQKATPFATIGIGACSDSKAEPAAPGVTASSSDSCTAPIAHDLDLASLSLAETHGSRGAVSYVP